MEKRTAIVFTYDKHMRPVSARCGLCSEEMPTPPADLHLPADVILWLSAQFLEHKHHKHTDTGPSDHSAPS